MATPSLYPQFMKRTASTKLFPQFMEPGGAIAAAGRFIREYLVRMTRTFEEEVQK